ncbi:MAG: glycosyltransferase family 2 protein, partial [bacterium]|nr:glycosyltransferase family 2 protein [bacterium]
KSLVEPPISKPLPFREYSKQEAESGGQKGDEDVPLVLIQNGSNGGYSAGNNVGIRYALHKDCDYIWLLNNDTVIERDTLGHLLDCAEKEKDTGIVGASIMFTSDIDRLQTHGGGIISSVTGLDRFAVPGESVDYITGTSLFIKKAVLQATENAPDKSIGLLDDGFFFYWEDVDFSHRAVKAGWKLEVAEKALVYHKFSASVGSQSLKSDLFKTASLTRYFKKHRRGTWLFPVWFNITGMLVNRLLRRQFGRIFPILKETFKACRNS